MNLLTALNGINALFTVLLVLTAAVVTLAYARRSSREQLSQTAQEWQDIAVARSERIDLLQGQLNALQAQILAVTTKTTQVEMDNRYLQEQNLRQSQTIDQLRRVLQRIRDRCAAAGWELGDDLES